MQPDLFPIDLVLSPLAKWKAEHDIAIFQGNSPRYVAYSKALKIEGHGSTEDEALTHLAKKAGLKFYGE